MELAEVEALARARPWADQPWATGLVADFPRVLAGAVGRWGVEIEGAHTDGAGLPVLRVRRGGLAAVVKFDGAGTALTQQVRVLQAADGRGYVRVLDHAEDLGAVLLERLGPPLSETTPDPVEQTDVLAGLLTQAWCLPVEVGLPYPPDAKARQLLSLLESEQAHGAEPAGAPGGPRAGAPGAEPFATTLARAVDLARALAESPASRQVVVHGDPHAQNALGRDGSHAFVDPDGFLCEPEYDAGVALRDLRDHIDLLDAREGHGAGRRWHATLVDRVSAELGLDRERVAAWAFVERVTTGVWLGRLGYAEEGRAWLTTAARM